MSFFFPVCACLVLVHFSIYYFWLFVCKLQSVTIQKRPGSGLESSGTESVSVSGLSHLHLCTKKKFFLRMKALERCCVSCEDLSCSTEPLDLWGHEGGYRETQLTAGGRFVLTRGCCVILREALELRRLSNTLTLHQLSPLILNSVL